MKKFVFCFIVLSFLLLLIGAPEAMARRAYDAKFDIKKMSDMSDFDPNNPIIYSGPDTIRIGLMQLFSGPGAGNGEIFWLTCNWVAHDYNKRGGIYVDGKQKKVVFLKGDTKGKPADTKKAAERLVLSDKVQFLWGTSGSHLTDVISQVANQYKIIHQNSLACSDYLMDEKHFSRYVFQTFTRNSTFGQAGAYYYAKRRKERKFYILCQDYSFGHSLAEEFKKGLKKYYPNAKIVGEDFHPLFAKDFAPYVTKIKASGAEVIYSGDWLPDGGNLLKTCRDMGVNLPILNIFIDEPNALHAIGVEGTKGLVNMNHYMGDLRDPARREMYTIWDKLWRTKWQKPYNTWLYKINGGTIAECIMTTYWLMSVIERAKSTDPEKIIKVWEGDRFKTLAGILEMRRDDHTAIRDLYLSEYVPPSKQKLSMTVPPYYWFKGISSVGKIVTVPAKYCTPTLDPKLKGRR
jgi:branched-chain amino acid transport system substrate-binding protein